MNDTIPTPVIIPYKRYKSNKSIGNNPKILNIFVKVTINIYHIGILYKEQKLKASAIKYNNNKNVREVPPKQVSIGTAIPKQFTIKIPICNIEAIIGTYFAVIINNLYSLLFFEVLSIIAKN